MRENEISGADFHSPVVITLEMALEALDYAVQLRGEDYVYPAEWKGQLGACQYSVNGEPACIVGVALEHLGVRVHGGDRPNESAAVLPEIWGLDVLDYDSYTVGTVLRQAQAKQDAGFNWGYAVSAAKGWVSTND